MTLKEKNKMPDANAAENGNKEGDSDTDGEDGQNYSIGEEGWK